MRAEVEALGKRLGAPAVARTSSRVFQLASIRIWLAAI
jgi:hypothetical protein